MYDVKIRNHSDNVSQILVFGTIDPFGKWIDSMKRLVFKPLDSGLTLTADEKEISVIAEKIIAEEGINKFKLSAILDEVKKAQEKDDFLAKKEAGYIDPNYGKGRDELLEKLR